MPTNNEVTIAWPGAFPDAPRNKLGPFETFATTSNVPPGATSAFDPATLEVQATPRPKARKKVKPLVLDGTRKVKLPE
jgi:hypothetical protein